MNKKLLVAVPLFFLLMGSMVHARALGIRRTRNSSAYSGTAGISNNTTTIASSGIFSLGGGGVILSTFSALGSAVQLVTGGTLTIYSAQAWDVVGSTVSALKFMVYTATATNFSNCWSRISPQIIIGTSSSLSVIYSTTFIIPNNSFVGVGIDTIPTAGTVPQDWGVSFNYWLQVVDNWEYDYDDFDTWGSDMARIDDRLYLDQNRLNA